MRRVIAVVALVVACSEPGSQPFGRRLSLWLPSAGAILGSAALPATNLVTSITIDSATWHRIWDGVSAPATPALPFVDFQTDMVLVLVGNTSTLRLDSIVTYSSAGVAYLTECPVYLGPAQNDLWYVQFLAVPLDRSLRLQTHSGHC